MRSVCVHTINGLLPERFETDRLRENLEFAARVAGHPAEEEAVRVRDSIPSAKEMPIAAGIHLVKAANLWSRAWHPVYPAR